MGVAGQGGSDMLRNVVTNVMHFIKKKQSPFTLLCDGRVLKMYYMYTFWLCIFIFSTVWYSWYNKDPMICVNKYNADAQVRVDFVNLCLSYNDYFDPVEEITKTMMFYKWIPFSVIVIGAIFYIPRKLSKRWEDPKTVKLLDWLAARQGNETVDECVRQIYACRTSYNGLFYKFWFLNVLAPVLNLSCMHVLDFFLQGRFRNYGLTDFYNRDPQFYTDSMSRTFPPFVQCRITPVMKLTSARNERYGCHLTLMELYEKLFFILWWWMVIVMISSAFYLVFLFAFRFLPRVQHYVLRGQKPQTYRREKFSHTESLTKLLGKIQIGEIYLLYRLKAFFTPTQYFDLIHKLEKKFPDVDEDIQIHITEEKYAQFHQNNQQYYYEDNKHNMH